MIKMPISIAARRRKRFSCCEIFKVEGRHFHPDKPRTNKFASGSSLVGPIPDCQKEPCRAHGKRAAGKKINSHRVQNESFIRPSIFHPTTGKKCGVGETCSGRKGSVTQYIFVSYAFYMHFSSVSSVLRHLHAASADANTFDR